MNTLKPFPRKQSIGSRPNGRQTTWTVPTSVPTSVLTSVPSAAAQNPFLNINTRTNPNGSIPVTFPRKLALGLTIEVYRDQPSFGNKISIWLRPGEAQEGVFYIKPFLYKYSNGEYDEQDIHIDTKNARFLGMQLALWNMNGVLTPREIIQKLWECTEPEGACFSSACRVFVVHKIMNKFRAFNGGREVTKLQVVAAVASRKSEEK